MNNAQLALFDVLVDQKLELALARIELDRVTGLRALVDGLLREAAANGGDLKEAMESVSNVLDRKVPQLRHEVDQRQTRVETMQARLQESFD